MDGTALIMAGFKWQFSVEYPSLHSNAYRTRSLLRRWPGMALKSLLHALYMGHITLLVEPDYVEVDTESSQSQAPVRWMFESDGEQSESDCEPYQPHLEHISRPAEHSSTQVTH